MIEFAVLVIALAVVLFLASRKGTEHLDRKGVLGVMMTVGWAAGVALYALPFTAVSPGVDVRTVVAGLLGLLVARLLVRVAQAWAIAHRGWEEKTPGQPPRLLHPAIAIGLFLSGVPVVYAGVAARHEALEHTVTPRFKDSGIVRGAESLSLDPPGGTDHVALLLHGFLASPSVFGALPRDLVAAGVAVRAPLLPGHGTRPDDLMGVTEDDWLEAVKTAYDEAAADHARVSVVGFSMGGTLALDTDFPTAPHRMALINPYLGSIATPSWMPIETDDLIGLATRLTPRVFRPDSMVRINDPAGLERLVTYRTIPLESVTALRRLGEQVRAREALPLPCPTLVLISDGDQSAPPEAALAWASTRRTGPPVKVRRFARSNHVLLLDYDAKEAGAAIVEWLTR